MRRACLLCLGLTVACLMCVSLAAEDKQTEAEELVAKARNISDIRAAGSSPFRMIAKVRISNADKHSTDGTYAEVWVSPGQWRRETVLGDERRIDVVAQKKSYLADTVKNPSDAAAILRAMRFSDVLKVSGKVVKLKDMELGSFRVRCMLGNPETLCFDKASGRLFSRSFFSYDSGRLTAWFCEYSDYQNFTDRKFPGAIACTENRQEKLRIGISELSRQDSFESNLFEPPAGSAESDFRECSYTTRPEVIEGPDPEMIHGFGSGLLATTVRVTIDEKGLVHDPRVTKSGGPMMDHWAVTNILGWHYKPAACDGVPISTQMTIDFRTYR